MSEYRVVASDELCHRQHLYTKREWKNGHWVYWYYKPADKFYKYDRHVARTGKLVQTYSKDKNGQKTVASERVVNPKQEKFDTKWSKNSHRVDKTKNDFRNAKYAGKYLHETDEQHRQRIDSTGRNYAAYMQERGRLEKAYSDKKLKNRAKKWFSKVLTTKFSVSSAKSKKKGQKWLSKVLSTSKTTTHHSFGTTTTNNH